MRALTTHRDPDLRALAACRIALGLVLLARTTPWLGPWPLLGWPDPRWHSPALIALPDAFVAALCVLRTAGALAFVVGYRTRLAGFVAAIAGWLVAAQDPLSFVLTLHLLYLGTLLCALTDAGSALALRGDPPRSPASGRRLLRGFVASVYAWAAIAKLSREWLDGSAILLLRDNGGLRGPVASALAATEARRTALALAVLALEASLGPLLLWRRTRRAALWAAYGFHAALEVTTRPDVFGWAMAAMLLVFVDARDRRAITAHTRPAASP